MKILQINKFFYLKGGSERYFFDVSTALQEAGHEVMHFSMKDPKNVDSPYSDFFIENVDFSGKKTLQKAKNFISSPEATQKLQALLNAELKRTGNKPDVAHLHNIAHQLTPSIIDVLKKNGIPVVQTLHDYQLICPNYQLFTQGSPCQRCNQHKYWNAIQYKCVQNSRSASALSALEMSIHNIVRQTYKRGVSRFIAPSKFIYNLLQEWGWNEKQLSYVPHFVDIQPNTNIQKKRTLLYAGRITREKGVHMLPSLAQRMPADTELIIAGTGPEEKVIQKIIAEKGIQNCRLVGFQSEHQMYTLMQQAEAVLVPSLWYENAPLVVYEALALQTPVLASRIGGLPELIEHGKNGYVCTPGSVEEFTHAIEQVFLGAIPPVEPNIYTKKKHLNQLLNVYEQVV